MAYNNQSLQEISFKTNHPIKTIQAWFIQFKKRGLAFIKGEKDFTKRNIERRNRENRIISILHHSPSDFGINRSAWILNDIARVYHQEHGVLFSSKTIRTAIKKTDYSWKRAGCPSFKSFTPD